MDYFNENLRYLLWDRDHERSQSVDPGQRFDTWSMRLNAWIGDASRARALLLGESPSDGEVDRLHEVTGRDEETLRHGRLAVERSILTENICFLLATVERGQMAALAERIGVNQSTIQRWRTGSKPGADKQSAILAEFGLPANYELSRDALFLSLDPIGLRQKRDWLKQKIDQLDANELNEVFSCTTQAIWRQEMKLVDCGTSGTDDGDVVASWSDLDLGPPWTEVIEALAPNTTPRDVQKKAFSELRILEQRKNLIVGRANEWWQESRWYAVVARCGTAWWQSRLAGAAKSTCQREG